MEKLKINIVADRQMSRVLHFEEGKTPTKIEYVKDSYDYDGISVFIDKCFDLEQIHIVDSVKSKIKCAWMHEPRALSDLVGSRYAVLETFIHKFDYVMTYDEQLLKKYPNKCIFTADNGIWIQDENIKIWDKTKLMSMIYSWKKWTEGHKLRHLIANQNIEGLDLYGDGSPHPVAYKEEALKDYQYSIAIENSRSKYYFTEKLLDCFAVGTIPIYWGCKNIGKFFDTRGILEFNDLEELAGIFNEISKYPTMYNTMFPFVKENFERAKEFIRYEDWIYKNVYSKMLGIKNETNRI
jgi:hypothetical protein